MNIFFRVLLAVYAFCLTILSLISMMFVFKPDIFKWMSNYLVNNVLYSRNESIAMFIISFIFFSLSLTFLMSGFKSDKDKKGLSKHTNIGEIKISLDTLESIALAASRKLNGVRETKANLFKFEDSVSVMIRAVVMPDINIPLLSEDIQVKVKKAIEDSSGIRVNDVKVVVENIYTGYKSRVE
ncbi:MAG: alkaline shock response membrane anchor protein AmaP [Clostridia bacterium]|nr:alkaline shock response membrane anchor protein AmaP [Clostridia bacterium]